MFEKFSSVAREAVVVAQEDARQLRSPRIEAGHLLLGVVDRAEPPVRDLMAARGHTPEALREALADRAAAGPLGTDDAAALRSVGIDLDAVRDSVARTFGPDAWDRAEPTPRRGFLGRVKGMNFGHIPFTAEARKSLECALREAIARSEKEIGSAHLVLGVLRAAEPATLGLLGGKDAVRSLRLDLYDLLDQAA
ncbi:Clp protease N-terminal domain-containing protein [Nocardia thailandica]|uniref:Clp protease N-terminal domain-containing protein n=1 Tax=Nocardia thailandica TaxID=257275 RepID=UPI0002D6FCEE|nr:Clp protease N-terminal domain-containing protein [Nocardia thailandica]